MAMNQGEPLWTRTDFILADLIDASNGVAWCVANKDVPQRKQSTFPKPYPRPGMAEAAKPKISAAALLDFRERTRRE